MRFRDVSIGNFYNQSYSNSLFYLLLADQFKPRISRTLQNQNLSPQK